MKARSGKGTPTRPRVQCSGTVFSNLYASPISLPPPPVSRPLFPRTLELTTQCSGILSTPALSFMPMSRILAATISSMRSSPPLTFSASLRMLDRI